MHRMVTVQCWTGAETKALRQAMRLSIRAFAAHLGIDARTVNKWETRRGTITLRPDTQALAIDAAEAALNTASHKASRVSAVAMSYAAHAHALNSNKASCERSYAMSQDLAAQLEVDPTSPWALFFNHSYLEVQQAQFDHPWQVWRGD